jgi:hypothetical protein
MSEPGTIADLWRDIRRVESFDMIELGALAMSLASEMVLDTKILLVEKRRALLVAQIIAHHIVFDMMGLPPDPMSDLSDEPPAVFVNFGAL